MSNHESPDFGEQPWLDDISDDELDGLDDFYKVEIPDSLDREWVANFNADHAYRGRRVAIPAESGLVQDPGSATKPTHFPASYMETDLQGLYGQEQNLFEGSVVCIASRYEARVDEDESPWSHYLVITDVDNIFSEETIFISSKQRLMVLMEYVGECLYLYDV